MDLNEQAQAALEATLEHESMVLPYAAASVARQMWLLGFKAGMDVTHALAQDAFEKLERAL